MNRQTERALAPILKKRGGSPVCTKEVPTTKLTYPTLRKRKSSANIPWGYVSSEGKYCAVLSQVGNGNFFIYLYLLPGSQDEVVLTAESFQRY